MTQGTFPKTIESAAYDFVLIQSLIDENERLKQAFQDQIDYHHFIGNRDCPITANEAFIHLYKSAQSALTANPTK
jgi:hypothetical protein